MLRQTRPQSCRGLLCDLGFNLADLESNGRVKTDSTPSATLYMIVCEFRCTRRADHGIWRSLRVSDFNLTFLMVRNDIRRHHRQQHGPVTYTPGTWLRRGHGPRAPRSKSKRGTTAC